MERTEAAPVGYSTPSDHVPGGDRGRAQAPCDPAIDPFQRSPNRRAGERLGEYRYSSFDVDFDTTNSFLFPTMNGRVETTVKSDRIQFGISYRFVGDPPRKEASR